MTDSRNDSLLRLAALRENLLYFVDPKVLSKIVDLVEAMGTDRNTFLKQFQFWIKKNGPDCRYAAMAKTFFLEDQAEKIALEINWLYHNFGKHYEGK